MDLGDTTRCPRGVRCESCGVEQRGLRVCVVDMGRIGAACLTLCRACAGSTVTPPVTIATAYRLVAQHAGHLGIDLDEMAEAMRCERGDDR